MYKIEEKEDSFRLEIEANSWYLLLEDFLKARSSLMEPRRETIFERISFKAASIEEALKILENICENKKIWQCQIVNFREIPGKNSNEVINGILIYSKSNTKLSKFSLEELKRFSLKGKWNRDIYA